MPSLEDGPLAATHIEWQSLQYVVTKWLESDHSAILIGEPKGESSPSLSSRLVLASVSTVGQSIATPSHSSSDMASELFRKATVEVVRLVETLDEERDFSQPRSQSAISKGQAHMSSQKGDPTHYEFVSSRAKQLAHQVREALNVLEPPKPTQEIIPLQEALLRLKPLLDRIVAKFSPQNAPLLGKTHLPESSVLPQAPQKTPLQESERNTPSLPTASLSKEHLITRTPPRPPIHAAERGRGGGELPQKERESPYPHSASRFSSGELLVKASTHMEVRDENVPPSRYIPQAGPYLPQLRTTASMKRKKRKGFWFREEEEEKDSSRH